jgi:hypothetical protein
VRGLLVWSLVSLDFDKVLMNELLEKTNLVEVCCRGHLVNGIIAIDDQGGPLTRTGGIGVLGGDSSTSSSLRDPESSSFVLRFLL